MSLLYRNCASLRAYCSGPEQGAAFRDRFTAALYPCFPPSFGSALYAIFEHLLAVREAETSASARVVDNMHLLGLISRYKPIMLRFVYDEIEKRVQESCAGEWVESELGKTHQWFGSEIATWVRSILYPRRSAQGGSQTKEVHEL